MKRKLIFTAVSLLVIVAMLVSAGCGGPANVASVTGTVTLGGQPLADATVTFVPVASGSLSRAITDANGRYKLVYSSTVQGAEIGEHKVAVTTYSGGDPDGDPPKPKVSERVPVKYNLQTELKATVTSGANVLDFSLDADGPVVQPDSREAERRPASDPC